MMNNNDTLLLIIDIQEKLLNAVYNKDIVEKKSQILAKTASILNIPTIVTEQYPQGLGATVDSIKSLIDANSEIYEKTEFNAMLNPKIKEAVLSKNKKTVILLGIESHICVYQTAEALQQDGFKVVVAADAVSSRSEYEYSLAMSNLKNININVKSAEMIVFELLKSAKHPNFKEIQQLIK
ncbi:isochorismatase family protein [bacterium]|nr:isochorismatase family protein [bacterium]